MIGTIISDRRGAALPIMVAGLMVMIASVGSAIDIARLYIAKSQMQAGVDAAALAGANAFDNTSTTDPNGRRQQIVAYYRDNFSNNFMGVKAPANGTPVSPTNTLMEPQFTTVNGISRTVVTASGAVPMTFMAIFGMGPQEIGATAQADFQPQALEVMVVLDNTGSMQETVKGVSKISALKSAMHKFINVLWQGGNNPQPALALGIINYTNVANVGSILKQYSIPIENMPGFTDQNPDWASGNALAWKGCTANDDSITNMSGDIGVREPEAHDIWNKLPGETPPGASKPMRAIRPHFSPPTWLPAGSGDAKDPASTFYQKKDDASTNLYPADAATLKSLANTATYKKFFYRYYISLNSDTNNANDVITEENGGYYDPKLADSYNWRTGSGRPFTVKTENIPHVSEYYKEPKLYQLTSNTGPMPTPNWQCPEPGLPIEYNVSRKTYDDFIDKKVWAILPAAGTVHHSGLIWGWRFLSRYSTFKRTPPSGSGFPTRVLVFMTDGETVVPITGNEGERRFHYYGTSNDLSISTKAADVPAESDKRFKKICSSANATTFDDSGQRPKIFVVAINSDTDIKADAAEMLKECGTSGYWLTTSSNELADAFTQIGRTLIDVHLTK